MLRYPVSYLFLALSGLLAVPVLAQTASPQKALINQYCLGCHNDKAKVAGLDLTTSNVDNVESNPDLWEKVLRKVRARYMPPAGLPRPDETKYNAMVSYLETSLDRLVAAHPDPGRTDTFRRMNRTEYRNAIRDLLALDVDVSAMLPRDDSSYGFDNVTVGGLSATLLERYMTAAQKISRLAVGRPIKAPGGDTIMLPADLTQEQHFDELPLGTRGGTVVNYTFPVDAEYVIQLRISRDRNEHVEGMTETQQLELALDGQRVKLFTMEPPENGQYAKGHQLFDNDLNVRVPIKAGPHSIEVAFVKKPTLLQTSERQPFLAHFNMDRHPRISPALFSVSVTGPYGTSGATSTPSRERIFVCHPANASEEEACAKKIFASLAKRAYRRPVTDADVQSPMKFFRNAKGEGFEAGIETALQAFLVSPEFLFRIERDPAGVAANTAYRLSDMELASRLSFFLWSSIPDDQLLDLAIAGKLKDPETLERQVRRMLADKRSEAMVNNFADQWLYLRNLASTTPDPRNFPDFDDNLRQAFRRETELFFESVMREDRSLLDLLNANYTFVNERLAKHYGIPNVYGSQFRRVTFDKNDPRGGLLGQGSILAVTSYADRTSVVIRGKWILTNILGTPPPPPPPNVPPLKDQTQGKVLSMRERMAAHRSNPACMGCHKLMDPIGFSLENYDAVGRYRVGEGGNPIDATGNLPDGVEFKGQPGLKAALSSRPEMFVTTTTEKLLTYATGRGLEAYDQAAIRKIVRDSSKSDYRFSSLILGVVNSAPFQMRRSK
jgi:uncharacterized protein DUF1592/uncharacterized protein DUF1588/uncharacterized protein DUF1585/uncharacterized protein DUF1587/uncharacterized protein DUF1595/cbb3-type cytochrome c oxidase subunit III